MKAWTLVGLLLALLGGAGTALGFAWEPVDMAWAWLAAWSWGISTALGALVLLMLHHVAPIKWMAGLRRPLSAIAAAVPVLALGFVPVVLSLSILYPWVGGVPMELPEHLRHIVKLKEPWLDEDGFVVRGVLHLAAWSLLAVILRALALRDDADAVRAQRLVSLLGLPVLAFSLTWATWDWIISLDLLWSSTLLGGIWWAGGMVGGLSLLILLTWGLERSQGLPPLPPDVHHALGRLLLVFVGLWAYTSFSQLLIQWIGNAPIEIRWYVPRLNGGWWGWFLVLVGGHFFLPLALLLSRLLKRSGGVMALLGVWMLAMHAWDTWWLVLPAHTALGPALGWTDLSALVAVGGALLAAGTWRIADRAAAPALLRWTLAYRSQ